jgi:hypothetical protein
MHGTDVNSKGQCGWYLNDKKKVSNDYHFLKPEEYVWRQH